VKTTGGCVSGTKQFVWDDSQLCEARNGSGNVTAQFFGLGGVTGGTSCYYTHDHLGSIREMTDSVGTIVAQCSYDPYGQVTPIGTPSVNSDFQYAGMYRHARSGFDLTGFRQYDSGLARWLSRDPIEEFGGLNLYRYVKNNPISGIDPDGLGGLKVLIEGGKLLRTGFKASKKCLSISQAAALRNSGGNVRVTARGLRNLKKVQQTSNEIEETAKALRGGNEEIIHHPKDFHKNRADGTVCGHQGHYQSEGLRGHTFYRFLSSVTFVGLFGEYLSTRQVTL
jgi:RHS repeat-associated protein